ncbi:MAG: DNA-directed RNA polymerase subunit alpha [Candidatus Roizmanbacteria bacterium]
MIQPNFSTKIEVENLDYAKIVLEPLHSSFGQSLGNALRRTLLSSLRGAAIGYVKIDGVSHLFSTVKGVKESVLDIVLNLKQLKFEVPADGEFHIKLSKTGASKIYGRDIEGEVKVVNGDVYICELTESKAVLHIDAIVETGYGYVSTEEKEGDHTDYITVDSSFSPVKKVNFQVEQARVGSKSNFDRLIMEVWTDGSISPINAVKESAGIISSYFGYLQSGNDALNQITVTNASLEKVEEDMTSKLDDIIIDELNLPSRVINALLRENIETVADLIKRGRDKLVGLKGVGRKSIDLIEEELKKMSIELK